MKKNVGSLLALYPAPVTVIGAMNGISPPGPWWGMWASSATTGFW